MEISGYIKYIDETKSFGGNGFRKREIVITTDEQYPQHIMIEFTQDKCDLLNNYIEGELVTVGINLRGREWVNPQGETKYFNSIQGWKIFRPDTQQQQQPQSAVDNYQQRQQTQTNPQQVQQNNNQSPDDDLPF